MKLNDVIFAGYSKVFEHNITGSLLVHTGDMVYGIHILNGNNLHISRRKCLISYIPSPALGWEPLDIKGLDELQAHILIKML